MTEAIEVQVCKATFCEIGRYYKRVYRPEGVTKVVLTLGQDLLSIEYGSHGADLSCANKRCLSAELSARAFAHIVAQFHKEKYQKGIINFTFYPELGKVVTRLVRATAKFKNYSDEEKSNSSLSRSML